jgi:hypothetical protein
MLAISIRQPWASLIMRARKDIENRNWTTKVRGRVLVHAAKGMTRCEWEDAIEFAVEAIKRNPPNEGKRIVTLRELGFDFEALQRGGIIGSVEIVDCIRQIDSPWFVGPHGFVLRNPEVLPFTPWKGQLGFFNVPESALMTSRPNKVQAAKFELTP